jgi:hypothetical protein
LLPLNEAKDVLLPVREHESVCPAGGDMQVQMNTT